MKESSDQKQDADTFNTLLLTAAEKDDVAAINRLLERGANIEAIDRFSSTPLHRAAAQGQLEAVRLLLEKGAKIEAIDRFDSTPLHCAAIYGQREVATLLLDRGANVNAIDNTGKTPLHCAAGWWSWKTEAIGPLLEKGANVNAIDNTGKTPLHYAAVGGQGLEAVRPLLEKGANIEATDKDGKTPRQLAAERKYSGRDYQKTINLLNLHSNPHHKKKIAALAVSGILITSLGVTLCITTGAGIEIAGVGIAYIKAALITAGALQLIESLAKWRAWFANTSPRFAQAGKFIQIVAAAALIAVGIGIMISTWGAGSLVSLGLFSIATEILGALLITAGATSAVSALWHNVTNSTLWHNVKTKSIACCSSQPQETVSLPAPS